MYLPFVARPQLIEFVKQSTVLKDIEEDSVAEF